MGVSASVGTLGQTDRTEAAVAKIRPFDRLAAWLDENKRKPNRLGKDKEERSVSPIWCECAKEYARFSDLVQRRGRSSKPEDADAIVDATWKKDMRRFGYYLGLLESDQSWIDAGCGREVARREDTRNTGLGRARGPFVESLRWGCRRGWFLRRRCF